MSKVHKVAVIGSGPAGWTAALYLARANLEPLIFEGELSEDMLPGGQLMTTTEIENYPGFPDGGISGSGLIELFQRQAEEFGAKTVSETVIQIEELPICNFMLTTTDKRRIEVHSVVFATGATAKYLGLESEKLYLNRGVSACATCDGALPRFRNQPIVVVGGGDTAAEEAMFLARFGSQVYVVHRRDKLRASPIMAKRLQEHAKVKMVWDTVVEEVLGNDVDGVTGVRIRNVKTDETSELECSGFFAAIGHKPNSDLLQHFNEIEMDENGYVVTEPNSTCVGKEGLFVCGDVQDHKYRQAITAAGSGCMAAIDCTRWLEANESLLCHIT